ncbi:hypothetical protein DXG03_006759 [Asterophora parasitica]|uniref:F-box domain-containing protein n=1 Tax=Asterophora parasitica TaxID=117018 RepID=A0A9P7K8A1_9AGAR|nr:hypothetical protein DXG03_006759 [Asterophora parasitica]
MEGNFGVSFWEMRNDIGLMNVLWCPEPSHKRITTIPYADLRPERIIPRTSSNSSGNQYCYPNPSAANTTGKGFGLFSVELVDLIIDHVDDLEDIICLAATCQRLYEISRHHLEVFLDIAFTISWAGDRLICIGDWTEVDDDLPPGMLDDDECDLINEAVYEYDASQLDPSAEDDYNPILKGYILPPRLAIALHALRDAHPDAELQRFKRKIYKHSSGYPSTLYMKLAGHSSASASTSASTSVPGPGGRLTLAEARVLTQLTRRSAPLTEEQIYSGKYVLRNIVMQEYVRGDAIRALWDPPSDSSSPRRLFVDRLRFEHVLVFKTAWSTRGDGLGIRYSGPVQVHRGAWSGHVFDLVETQSLLDDSDGSDAEGWSDVSEKVLNEIMEVWKEDIRGE